MHDIVQLNADMLEYWAGSGGERWISQQERRDAILGGFGVSTLRAADARPGETAIDIGCGCGETAEALARSVGTGGKILAVDVSAPILKVATARLEPYAQASTVLADAAEYRFEPSAADLIFSRFGVMFFGDPLAAFTNIRSALKPTGRLVFACWRTPKENRWMSAPGEAVAKHFPDAPKPDPEAPGPFAFCDRDRVAGILTAAGFKDLVFEPVDQMMDLANGQAVQGAVGSAMELGPAARFLDGQNGDDIRRTVAQTLTSFFTPLLKDGRVELAGAIWIVSGRPA